MYITGRTEREHVIAGITIPAVRYSQFQMQQGHKLYTRITNEQLALLQKNWKFKSLLNKQEIELHTSLPEAQLTAGERMEVLRQKGEVVEALNTQIKLLEEVNAKLKKSYDDKCVLFNNLQAEHTLVVDELTALKKAELDKAAGIDTKAVSEEQMRIRKDNVAKAQAKADAERRAEERKAAEEARAISRAKETAAAEEAEARRQEDKQG